MSRSYEVKIISKTLLDEVKDGVIGSVTRKRNNEQIAVLFAQKDLDCDAKLDGEEIIATKLGDVSLARIIVRTGFFIESIASGMEGFERAIITELGKYFFEEHLEAVDDFVDDEFPKE